WKVPPGRRSIFAWVTVAPFGPHHCCMCAGSVKHLHTSSRGASNTREMTKSSLLVSARLMTILADLVVAIADSGRLRRGLFDHDHPAHPEPVLDHAEGRREEGLDQRLMHLAAVRQRREQAACVGLVLGADRQREAFELGRGAIAASI